MSDSGDIEPKGRKISINATGDVAIKGTKIGGN